MVSQKILNLESVTLHRGGSQVLRDISFEVGPGECIVIQGDNGSGKTSLLKAILGLLPVTSGLIRLRGSVVGSSEWKVLRKSVAWVPQEGVLHRFPVAAREVVAAGLAGRSTGRRDRIERIDMAMEQAGAAHLSERCFHRLSGGERQRVSIARCLAQGADILLLDEPSAALDAGSRDRLVNLTGHLAESGRTLVVVTHEKELFDGIRWKAYRLEEGRLC